MHSTIIILYVYAIQPIANDFLFPSATALPSRRRAKIYGKGGVHPLDQPVHVGRNGLPRQSLGDRNTGACTLGIRRLLELKSFSSTSTIQSNPTIHCDPDQVRYIPNLLDYSSFFFLSSAQPIANHSVIFRQTRKQEWPHYKKSCAQPPAAPHSPGSSSSVLSQPRPPSAQASAMRRRATRPPRRTSALVSSRAPSSRLSPCAGWARRTRPCGRDSCVCAAPTTTLMLPTPTSLLAQDFE